MSILNEEAVRATLSPRKDAVVCLEKYLGFLQAQNRQDQGDVPYRVAAGRHILCLVCNQISVQVPHDVLGHKGCPVCAGNSPEASLLSYRKRLKEQGREDIDPSAYGCHRARQIRCLSCQGIQTQSPHNVLSGNGCTPCSLRKRGENATVKREKELDLVGRKFGYLLVLKYTHTDRARYWECE